MLRIRVGSGSSARRSWPHRPPTLWWATAYGGHPGVTPGGRDRHIRPPGGGTDLPCSSSRVFSERGEHRTVESAVVRVGRHVANSRRRRPPQRLRLEMQSVGGADERAANRFRPVSQRTDRGHDATRPQTGMESRNLSRSLAVVSEESRLGPMRGHCPRRARFSWRSDTPSGDDNRRLALLEPPALRHRTRSDSRPVSPENSIRASRTAGPQLSPVI